LVHFDLRSVTPLSSMVFPLWGGIAVGLQADHFVMPAAL
jgi:hypothetical protein